EHRLGVAGVQQALQDHPAPVEVEVGREVDPAETAVRQTALDLVLPGDQIARLELGGEGEAGAVIRAEALGTARPPVAGTADGLAALGVAAEALLLRNLGVDEHDL